jgi:flagellar basal-body rod modification protein FlgD
MRIDSVATSASGLDTGVPTAGAPKDEFLRLLVAQLQHQDPLSPQDSAAFVAQLAQFASLEQSAETNQRLANLEGSFASAERAGFADLVGKTVSARTETFSIPSQGVELGAHLEGHADAVTVTIYDSQGNEVKKLELGPRDKGEVTIPWDGTDENGALVADGDYRVEIKATAAGGAVSAYSQITGAVTALEFLGGSVRFRIGSVQISPADIVSVSEKGA